jgi:hypothetical protein
MMQNSMALVLGGGAIGSAIAIDLFHIKVPTAIVLGSTNIELRRNISFADTFELGKKMIHNILATFISPEDLSIKKETPEGISELWLKAIDYHIHNRSIPVWKKGEFIQYLDKLQPQVIINTAQYDFPEISLQDAPLVLGLYPFHKPGIDCHFSIESRYNYWMGEIYSEIPPPTKEIDFSFFRNPFEEIKAPLTGTFLALRPIGHPIKVNQAIGKIDQIEIRSPYQGEIWGILHSGKIVEKGQPLARIYETHSNFAFENFGFNHRIISGAILKKVVKFLQAN